MDSSEKKNECRMIDAMMDGPRFRGFNHSMGLRVFKKYWENNDE